MPLNNIQSQNKWFGEQSFTPEQIRALLGDNSQARYNAYEHSGDNPFAQNRGSSLDGIVQLGNGMQGAIREDGQGNRTVMMLGAPQGKSRNADYYGINDAGDLNYLGSGQEKYGTDAFMKFAPLIPLGAAALAGTGLLGGAGLEGAGAGAGATGAGGMTAAEAAAAEAAAATGAGSSFVPAGVGAVGAGGAGLGGLGSAISNVAGSIGGKVVGGLLGAVAGGLGANTNPQETSTQQIDPRIAAYYFDEGGIGPEAKATYNATKQQYAQNSAAMQGMADRLLSQWNPGYSQVGNDYGAQLQSLLGGYKKR